MCMYVAGFTLVVTYAWNGFTVHAWESALATLTTSVHLSVGNVAVEIARLKLKSFTASVGHPTMNLSMACVLEFCTRPGAVKSHVIPTTAFCPTGLPGAGLTTSVIPACIVIK